MDSEEKQVNENSSGMSFTDVMKDTVKVGGLGMLGVLALGTVGGPFLAVLLFMFAGVKLAGIIGDSITKANARDKAIKSKQSELKAAKRAQLLENLKRNLWDKGWRAEILPPGMTLSRGYSYGKRTALFDCAGVEGAITARYLGRGRLGSDKCMFSFGISDPEKAELIAQKIREGGLVNAKVIRNQDGTFLAQFASPDDCVAMFQNLHPIRKAVVEKTVRTTRQFIVGGCSSYEEALREYQRHPERYNKPVNIYKECIYLVDGVYGGPGSFQYEPEYSGMLHPGEFVVNSSTSDVYSHEVQYRSPVDATPAADRSVAVAKFEEMTRWAHDGITEANSLVEDRCIRTPDLSVCKYYVPRVFEVRGKKIEFFPVEKVADRLKDVGARIVLRSSSLEGINSLSRDDFSGRLVSVETGQPARDKSLGGYELSIPFTRESISLIDYSSGDASRVAEQMGVPVSDVSSSLLLDDIYRTGHSAGRLSDRLPAEQFDRATVNGVPLKEFQRASESVKTEDQLQGWMKDASTIQGTWIDWDFKNRTVTLNAQVGTAEQNTVVSHTEHLSDEQMDRMACSSQPGDFEMKDMLMRACPDKFPHSYGSSLRAYASSSPLSNWAEGKGCGLDECAAVTLNGKQKAEAKRESQSTLKSAKPKKSTGKSSGLNTIC